MTYNPKEEMTVLLALKELGLASPEEIGEMLEKIKNPVLHQTVRLVLERWKARDVVVVDLSTGTKRYKLANVPAPFQSMKMENIAKLRLSDTKQIMAELNAAFPESTSAIKEPVGKIGNYKTLELTYETIDPILGGTPVDGETEFKLHRDGDNVPVISPAQLRGWFRENLRLLDINPNAHNWMAFTDSKPIGEPKLTKVSAPVVIKGRGGTGIAHYECFDRGNKFRTIIRIPLNGVGFKSISDVERMFKMCEVCPKRGLGANPYYVGGKVRLLEMKEV